MAATAEIIEVVNLIAMKVKLLQNFLTIDTPTSKERGILLSMRRLAEAGLIQPK